MAVLARRNPAYYEYTYDTAWHSRPQDLTAWFQDYPTRRYGSANEHAQAAWQILRSDVYNYGGCGGFNGYHDGTGVEWKVWGAPPTCAAPTAANASAAWQLLVQAGATISEPAVSILESVHID
jgi:hypothetical protein